MERRAQITMKKLVVWESRHNGWCWELYGDDNCRVMTAATYPSEDIAHKWGLLHALRKISPADLLDLAYPKVREFLGSEFNPSLARIKWLASGLGISIKPTGFGAEYKVAYPGKGKAQEASAGFADCATEGCALAIAMWREKYAPHSKPPIPTSFV